VTKVTPPSLHRQFPLVSRDFQLNTNGYSPSNHAKQTKTIGTNMMTSFLSQAPRTEVRNHFRFAMLN